jgi:hypothetical protein
MDFSPEGLRRQALSVFALIQTKRVLLPPKQTPEIKAQGEACYNKVNLALNDDPFLKQCVRDVIAYNKRGNQVGLFLVLFPYQCEHLEESVLRAQTMCVPLEGFQNVRLPPLPPQMEAVPSVLVRVEIYLTQQEDTNTWDYRALDPACYIRNDDDIDSLQRRISKEKNVPMELLQSIREIAEEQPEEFRAWVKSHADERQANNMVMSMMRSCNVCRNYGLTLFKCGGCRSVYYCSRECQHKDWKEHKKSCKK